MPYRNKQRGKWTAQVRHNGKMHRSQHETEAAAKEWEILKKKELEEQNQVLMTPTVSLMIWASRYLEHAEAKFVEKTFKEKHLAFRQLFKSVNHRMDAALLHKGLVLAHFRRQVRMRSGYAANKDRKNLVAAWNWAVHYIPDFPQHNPFLTERFPEERSPRSMPTEEEFWAVYHVAESAQDKLMLLCYLHLAARRNEIFHLRLEDVDLSRRRVRLFTRKQKDGSMRYDWLPMTNRLYHAMAKHLSAVAGPWVFPNPQAPELPYVARQHWLGLLCQKADVQPFGFHGIRHLSASILIRAKVSLLDLQTILRHTNLTTTQRYIHRLESVRNAVSVFDD